MAAGGLITLQTPGRESNSSASFTDNADRCPSSFSTSDSINFRAMSVPSSRFPRTCSRLFLLLFLLISNSLALLGSANADLYADGGLRINCVGQFGNLIPFDKAVTSHSFTAAESLIESSAFADAEFVATVAYQWNGGANTAMVSGGPRVFKSLDHGTNTLNLRVTRAICLLSAFPTIYPATAGLC